MTFCLSESSFPTLGCASPQVDSRRQFQKNHNSRRGDMSVTFVPRSRIADLKAAQWKASEPARIAWAAAEVERLKSTPTVECSSCEAGYTPEPESHLMTLVMKAASRGQRFVLNPEKECPACRADALKEIHVAVALAERRLTAASHMRGNNFMIVEYSAVEGEMRKARKRKEEWLEGARRSHIHHLVGYSREDAEAGVWHDE